MEFKKLALGALSAAVMGGAALTASVAPAEATWYGYGHRYRPVHYGFYQRPHYRRIFVGAPYYGPRFYHRWHFAGWGYGHRYRHAGWNGWGRHFW